jgi:hypothetical protein
MSNEKQEKQAQPKRSIQEKKLELAAERGSIVIIPNSGDEMFCMLFMLRQMDNAFTRLNKGSRIYSDDDVSAFKKELRNMTDSCKDIAERVCKYVGYKFILPEPLEKEKQQNVKYTIDTSQ